MEKKVQKYLRMLKNVCDNALRKKDIFIPRNDPLLSLNDVFSSTLQSSAVSIAPKTKTLHYHADIVVTYRGNSSGYFHMNREVLHDRILQKLPVDNVYINFTFVKNFNVAVTKYIEEQTALDPNFDYEENFDKKYRKNGRDHEKEEEEEEL